ncbi:enoyl-CoA hydratase/isomerase family protein [Achromobacter marplatensis]
MENRDQEYRESRLSIRGEVAVFTHANPGQRNALTQGLRMDYAEMIERVRSDDAVKALVLTGSGGSFCAGADIRAMRDRFTGVTPERDAGDAARSRILQLQDWLERLRGVEKPVIAAVDGPAFGAGFSIALAADFIVASQTATFSMVFNRLGVLPDMGAIHILPRLIGLAKARDLLMTARPIGAEEAVALGLVYEVCGPDALLDTALDLAGRFAQAPQPAIGLTKRLLNRSFEVDYGTFVDLEGCAQSACATSADHRDAVMRFLDREPARYDWDRLASKRAALSGKEST